MQASGRYKLGRRRSAAKVRRKTGLRSTRDPAEDTIAGPQSNMHFNLKTQGYNYKTFLLSIKSET